MHFSRRAPVRPIKKLGEYSREDALRAVENALLAHEGGIPAPAQLGDMADAIDSLGDHDYGIAVALAQAAMRPHRSIEKGRPPGKVPTLDEIRREFDALRKAL